MHGLYANTTVILYKRLEDPWIWGSLNGSWNQSSLDTKGRLPGLWASQGRTAPVSPNRFSGPHFLASVQDLIEVLYDIVENVHRIPVIYFLLKKLV